MAAAVAPSRDVRDVRRHIREARHQVKAIERQGERDGWTSELCWEREEWRRCERELVRQLEEGDAA